MAKGKNQEPEIIKKGYSRDRFNSSQIEELKKCMADPIYFCETYIKIQHPTKGRVKFELYPYQRELIGTFHNYRNSIALTARQMGKTTCAAGFLLWKAMFEPDTTILIAANKFVQAMEIMDRIKFAYENLEEYNWLRAGILEYNKSTISFDNGSKIISRATSKDAGRGLSISLLYLDEFAFVQPNKAEEFWSAVSPTLATGGSCIITSTPNNDEDQFAQIWHAANNIWDDDGNERARGIGTNDFKAASFTWHHHPDRKEDWARSERAKLGEDKFLREYECKFVSEDETLISNMTLANLKYVEHERVVNKVKWFERPLPNCIYGVALDPSHGTGGDYAAIQVYEMTSMRQVAEWMDKTTPIQGQIEILLKTLLYLYQTMAYHPDQVAEPEIYWTVENNSIGEAALVVIEDTGEENFPGTFVHEPRRSGGGTGRRRKGLNTNSRSKITSCSKFKSLVESRRMTLRSRALLTQLKNYVRGGGSFQARPGVHDDLVASTLLVVRILEIVAAWDENLADAHSEAIELNDESSMPMPIVV